MEVGRFSSSGCRLVVVLPYSSGHLILFLLLFYEASVHSSLPSGPHPNGLFFLILFILLLLLFRRGRGVPPPASWDPLR